MTSLPFLLAPLALLLPAVAGLPLGGAAGGERAAAAPGNKLSSLAPKSDAPSGIPVLDEALETPVQGQVRIEQRVIIRIAPSSPQLREPRMGRGGYREERLDGCVPIDGIAGVVPSSEDNRLLLFMRDRRVLSAALERSCRAEDYYLGFYIERGDDGQLCARRDKLQSRSGANCEVAQLSRLVAERD